MRRAEAVRQALIRIRSSIMWSLMLPGSVDWSMKTAFVCYQRGALAEGVDIACVPSSSRTDSPIDMLVSLLEYCRTMILASSIPSLQILSASALFISTFALPVKQFDVTTDLSATAFASAPWLLPVKSLIELVAMTPTRPVYVEVNCLGRKKLLHVGRKIAQMDLEFTCHAVPRKLLVTP